MSVILRAPSIFAEVRLCSSRYNVPSLRAYFRFFGIDVDRFYCAYNRKKCEPFLRSK